MLAQASTQDVAAAASPRGDAAARYAVTAVWLALSLALLGYVWHFGRDLPFMDDWELVPVLAGARPFSVAWLFEQTLEHRYVLGRALLYALWQLSHDFRTPMYLDALLLSATAWLLLRCARGLRGRSHWTDAALPLLLLHWGHYESLIFFLQLYFVLPVCLLLGLACLIASGRWQRPNGAFVFGLGLVALPLCGSMGMLWAPPLGAWALLAAWHQRGRVGAQLATAVAVAGLEALLYLRHLGLSLQIGTRPRTLASVTQTLGEALSMAFGPPGGQWSGTAPLLGATLLLGALALAWRGWRDADSRLRAWGLLAVLGCGALVALAIGWGRSTLGPGSGAQSRYALLLVPSLVALYFAAVRYADRLPGRAVPWLLLGVTASLLPLDTQAGLAYGRRRATLADAIERDLRAGQSEAEIGQRYTPELYPHADLIAQRLQMLRRASAGPYRHGVGEAPRGCRALALNLDAVHAHDAVREGKDWTLQGQDPYLVFPLPAPLRVCSLRIDYRNDFAAGAPVRAQWFWADATRGEVFTEARTLRWRTASGTHSQTFGIEARLDRLRWDPAMRAGRVRLDAITLFVEDEP